MLRYVNLWTSTASFWIKKHITYVFLNKKWPGSPYLQVNPNQIELPKVGYFSCLLFVIIIWNNTSILICIFRCKRRKRIDLRGFLNTKSNLVFIGEPSLAQPGFLKLRENNFSFFTPTQINPDCTNPKNWADQKSYPLYITYKSGFFLKYKNK